MDDVRKVLNGNKFETFILGTILVNTVRSLIFCFCWSCSDLSFFDVILFGSLKKIYVSYLKYPSVCLQIIMAMAKPDQDQPQAATSIEQLCTVSHLSVSFIIHLSGLHFFFDMLFFILYTVHLRYGVYS